MWKVFISSKPYRLIVIPKQVFIEHMVDKHLFFLHCLKLAISYKVKKDATVSIDKVSYDVPMQFIDAKVEIRFLPDDMSGAFILYDGEHVPVRATDKNENCHTKRCNAPSIDYSRIGGAH